MKPEELTNDLIAIMRIVKDKGGTDCSGTCHHRLPGEFHCHALAQMVKVSSSGVKERLLRLVNMGLLERLRIERDGHTPMARFVVTQEGEKVLAGLS